MEDVGQVIQRPCASTAYFPISGLINCVRDLSSLATDLADLLHAEWRPGVGHHGQARALGMVLVSCCAPIVVALFADIAPMAWNGAD